MGVGNIDERRYQVFISSTFTDLVDERREVIQALLELECFPAGMEMFPASNAEKWDLIKGVIDDSDYYLVIVGGRYGSVDEEGISYTEKEYDYAVATGKPVMGFLHADPGEIPKKFSESDAAAGKKLDDFREKVGKKMCQMWSSPDDLGSKVSRSLVNLLRKEPAEGWVRARHALTQEQLDELNDLKEQLTELRSERDIMRDEQPPGTEDFYAGDDEVQVPWTCQERTGYGSSNDWSGTSKLTWDQIFKAISPAMLDEAAEQTIQSRVNRATRLAAEREEPGDDDESDWPPTGEIENFRVTPEAWDQIKMQLVALKLIEKSAKRHGINDRKTYWVLTPFGETKAMTLMALKRGDSNMLGDIDDTTGDEVEE